jgi:hypothetical protein
MEILKKIILFGFCLLIFVHIGHSQKLPQITVFDIAEVKPFLISHLSKIADKKVTFRLLNNTRQEMVVYGSDIEGTLLPIKYLLRFNQKLNRWEYPTRNNKPVPWNEVSPTYKVEKNLKPGEYITFSSFFSSESDCGTRFKITAHVRLNKSKKTREIRSNEFTIAPCTDTASTPGLPPITANVENFVSDESEDGWIRFKLDLKFELKNTLNRKLFLLKDGFNLYGIKVFKNSTTGQKGELVLEYKQPASVSGNTKWLDLGEEMLSSQINSNSLISLSPNESIYFNKKYTLGFPTEKFRSNYRFCWNDVKNEESLLLEFNVNVWESEIRTKTISSEKFPIVLAEKIQKQGVLLFENVVSKPVAINLTSVTAKNE